MNLTAKQLRIVEYALTYLIVNADGYDFECMEAVEEELFETRDRVKKTAPLFSENPSVTHKKKGTTMSDRLKNVLKSVLDLYCHGEDCDMQAALRDISTCCRTLCNEHGVDIDEVEPVEAEDVLHKKTVREVSGSELTYLEVKRGEGGYAPFVVWYGPENDSGGVVVLADADGISASDFRYDDGDYVLPGSKNWTQEMKSHYLRFLPEQLFDFKAWGFVPDVQNP